MATTHVLFAQDGSNMAEDWTWELELVPQSRGWYRAKIKVHTDSPPRMPGLSFRFEQGHRLWEWLESNWDEVTLEPLGYCDGLAIASKLAAIDQAAGNDFKIAVMRSWIGKALEDHECLPERPSRLKLILSRTEWLDPIHGGGGGAGYGMARGLRMTAVAQFVRNHLAKGEPVPTGDLDLNMTYGPAGSGMDFVPPRCVSGRGVVQGRFRIEPDAVEKADEEIRRIRRRSCSTIVGVSDAEGVWLPGYPIESGFECMRGAYSLYRACRDQAVDDFVRIVSEAVPGKTGEQNSPEASCRLMMWIYEGRRPHRAVDPFGGAELVWRADGSSLGELLSVTYEDGEEQEEDIEAGGD